MNNLLKDISAKMVSRYSKRYSQLGYNVKTLGWGSVEQQEYRFSQSLSAISSFTGKHVLDIGCGFGDYYKFLKKVGSQPEFYTGYDLNPDLINEAKKHSILDSSVNFYVSNIFEKEIYEPQADIVVMFGVLNLALSGVIDNYEYSFKAIKNSFSLAKDLIVVDFLSTMLDKSYPKEDFVFYHDPIKMLEFALQLSPKVALKQDYSPIPQREFMLFIYK